MAGDWIKVEENMPDKPEVCRMAARLGIECDAVAGKLVRVWVWAGRNCNADGNTSVTVRALLDRLAGVTGFCEAMQDAGWLVVSGDTMTFPKFDRHCSQSAKDRADTQRRVSKHRAIRNSENVTTVTDEALPKRYQRREEKSNTPVVPKGTDKGPLQLRAEAIFRKRIDTPLDASEAQAFRKAKPALEATTEDDWLALEAFYRLPQSETRTRTSLAVLLNHWNGEIQRAHAWKTKHHTAQQTTLVSMS